MQPAEIRFTPAARRVKKEVSTIEVARFLSRYSDNDIRFCVIGVDGQCSFGSKNRFTEMAQRKWNKPKYQPTVSGFSSNAWAYFNRL